MTDQLDVLFASDPEFLEFMLTLDRGVQTGTTKTGDIRNNHALDINPPSTGNDDGTDFSGSSPQSIEGQRDSQQIDLTCPYPNCKQHTRPFSRKYDLDRHLAGCHGGPRYFCPVDKCKASNGGRKGGFGRRDNLAVHMRCVHKVFNHDNLELQRKRDSTEADLDGDERDYGAARRSLRSQRITALPTSNGALASEAALDMELRKWLRHA